MEKKKMLNINTIIILFSTVLLQTFSVVVKMPVHIGIILICIFFNPLPDDKILGWSQLKQIAEDIFKVH